MKKLIYSFAFLFLAFSGQAQFRLVVNGNPSWTDLGGNQYQATLTFHSDLTGGSYAVAGISDTMRIFTSQAQVFEIDSVWGKTFSQATLKATYLEGTSSAPVGQCIVYDPKEEYVPDAPFGNTGATAQANSAVVAYNATKTGTANSFTVSVDTLRAFDRDGTEIFSGVVTASSIADGDKGDVDVTSSGTVWTIDTSSILPSYLSTWPAGSVVSGSFLMQDSSYTLQKVIDLMQDSIPIGNYLPLAGGTMTGGIINSTSINPLTTLAESWIGPSSTTGIYFKGGNVGIRTTSPGAKLHVIGTKSSLATESDFLTMGIVVEDNTAYAQGVGGGIAFRGNKSTGSMLTYAAIDSYRESAVTSDFRGSLRFWTNQNSTGIPLERMRITSAGNVGINQITPTEKLHVVGNILLTGVIKNSAGSASLPSYTSSADLNTGMWFPAADNIAFSTAGIEKIRIDGSGAVIGSGYAGTYTAPTNGLLVEGNVNIGTTTLTRKLSVLDGTYNPQLRLSFDASNYADIYTNPTGLWSVASSGNKYGFNIGTPATFIHGKLDQNANTSLRIENVTSGAASKVGFEFVTDAAVKLEATVYSGTYSPSGLTYPHRSIVNGNGSGGLYFGSSDASGDVAIFSGGLSSSNIRIFAAASGNVGIGTTNPTSILSVQESGTGILSFVRLDAPNANLDGLGGMFDFYTNTAVTPDFFGRLGFKFEGGINTESRQFHVYVADAGTPKMVVNGLGKVGIATITPTEKLHVVGNVLLSGVIKNSAGSASLPSYTSSADLNTGMWFPAADQVALSTAGIQALTVDASQRVGIGTGSPSVTFHVETSSGNIAKFGRGANGNIELLVSSGDAQILYTNGTGITGTWFSGVENATNSFQIGNGAVLSGVDTKFIITPTGNVGIGTTSPFHLLSSYTSNPTWALTDTDVNLNVSSAVEAIDSAAFALDVSGQPTFKITGTDGDAMQFAPTTADILSFTGASGGYAFDSKMVIGSTSSPLQRLEVNGMDVTFGVFRSAGVAFNSGITLENSADANNSYQFRRDSTGNMTIGFSASQPYGGEVPIIHFDNADSILLLGTKQVGTSGNVRVPSGTTPVTALVGASDNFLVSGDATVGSVVLVSETSNTSAATFKGSRSRGTQASPIVLGPSDDVAQYISAGYDGTSLIASAGILMRVDSVITTGNLGQAILFQTSKTGTRYTRMQMGSNGVVAMIAGRFEGLKGSNTVSGTNITLPMEGNVFHITGTTTINTIVTTEWQAGSEIILIFDASVTVNDDGTSAGNIVLSGSANFAATANDVLKLVFDGTSWYEISRSIN